MNRKIFDNIVGILEPTTVGETYLVPTIYGEPVLGTLHNDIDHCFVQDQYHWHIDWRFTKDNLVDNVVWKDGPINYFWLVCQREIIDVPIPVFSYVSMINRYENHTLDVKQCKTEDGRKYRCAVCPHKGSPLVEILGSDIVKCPGHRLIWNLATGKLAFNKDLTFRIKGTDIVGKALFPKSPIDITQNCSVSIVELFSGQKYIGNYYFEQPFSLFKGDRFVLSCG